MQAIKSFLYLDEYKMYSISSQIFEGITEYLIDYQGTAKEQEEQQKGPVGSGRLLADILKSESITQERKYLHDYSYNLFEDRLNESQKILEVSTKNVDEIIDIIDDAGFVKVKAKPIFNDMNIIKSTIGKFNEIGEALAYAGSFEELNTLRQQLEGSVEATADRNEKARLRQKLKQLTNIESLAKEKGLYQDPQLLKNLSFLLNYGFQDQFEVQIPVGQYTFSAILKREHLRENEDMLVRKYSRFSERDFILFGTIAQSSSKSPTNGNEYAGNSNPQHMKEVIMSLVASLSEVEASLSGKLDNEVVIDPIALYREV